jgi:signal transduction histidine kinase/transcriptional regulator with XRE-family HTH domain
MVADVTPATDSQLLKLGDFIRRHRSAQKVTQVDLAGRLGWTQERISVLENGKYGMPSLPSLSHLASTLDTTLFAMLTAAGFGDEGISAVAQSDPTEHAGTVLLRTMRRLLTIEATSLEDALEQAADMVAEVMSADKVDAFILEPESDTLVALGSSNTPMGRKQFTIGMNRMPIANGGREVEVFQTGRSYRSGHAKDDQGMLVGVTEGLGVQSLLTVPLDVAGRRRGVLLAESMRPDLFTEEDLSFLETIATFIGVAAERAESAEQNASKLALAARRMAAEELLTVLAHDLRNHLTPVKAYIRMISKKAEREDHQDYLRNANQAGRAVDRIEGMIDELLDAARLDQGIFAVSQQPVDMVALLQDVAATFAPQEHPVDLELPDDLVGSGDPIRLRQALENLLSNAIEHSPKGVAATMTLRREARDGRDWAVIGVRDLGPGISAEALPTLFDRFAKGENSTGLGLGLYLARGIAEAHGGTLTVESEVDAGSRFYLSLPLN